MGKKCLSVPADLMARIYALCEGEDDLIAIMATVSAELFQAVEGFDWVGFYRVVAPNLLKIGPLSGWAWLPCYPI
jgi:GAF domain-containing protein